MTKIITTAIFLFVISFAVRGQNKSSSDQQHSKTQINEKNLFKISILYPYSEGKKFDIAYYETKHMPMVANLLGENLVKYTIEKGLSGGAPNQPAPYVAVGIFYVKDLSKYEAAIGPRRTEIRADIANYTDIAPIIMVSQLVR